MRSIGFSYNLTLVVASWRISNARTLAAYHRPPRAVGMRHSSSSRATARKLKPCPANRSARGLTASARRAAPAQFATAASTRAGAAFGLPSRVPRAFTTASAAFVRAEIASRSCWATAARM